MSPLGTECLDIFSPPPGAREVMTQVERLSSRDTKIALRSVRIAACSCGRGKRACMVAPAWVVQHPHSAREPGATNRTHGISHAGTLDVLAELPDNLLIALGRHDAIPSDLFRVGGGFLAAQPHLLGRPLSQDLVAPG